MIGKCLTVEEFQLNCCAESQMSKTPSTPELSTENIFLQKKHGFRTGFEEQWSVETLCPASKHAIEINHKCELCFI